MGDLSLTTRFGKTIRSCLYTYFILGPIRSILFVPTYIITYPFRVFMEKRKLDTLREKTRDLAVKGLWSFIIPLGVAYLTAILLVQEVEYVRTVNGQGPGSNGINQHVVKRILIGYGSFSFAVPYARLFHLALQLMVGFTVFHTVSFIFILAHYRGRAVSREGGWSGEVGKTLTRFPPPPRPRRAPCTLIFPLDLKCCWLYNDAQPTHRCTTTTITDYYPLLSRSILH